MMTTTQRMRESFAAGNRQSAEIILADVIHYGGEESLMVRWARLVLNKAERTVPATGRAA